MSAAVVTGALSVKLQHFEYEKNIHDLDLYHPRYQYFTDVFR